MKFHSDPVEESVDVPLADEGRWEALVAQFARRDPPATRRADDGNLCHVLSVRLADETSDADNKLREIVGLVKAQGDRVVGTEKHLLTRPDPRTFIGSGTARAISERARDRGADMLVLDAELSPSQTRNLEDTTGMPICDREAVILNVFQRHAHTRSAKIQVEVAQLEYLRPRIRGLGLNMDQQAGGAMNARGPGETASELLARRLDRRLAELRRSLAKLARSSDQQRSGRRDCATIALVGYTNAGKTSLMNALTGAELSARDSPFETLDTTSRSLTRRGGDVVLSDTVGFIRRLPERLFASFESTLSEIREACLLAIVVDLSDREWHEHMVTTERVIVKLGAAETERIYVFNKVDRIDKPNLDELRGACRDNDFYLVSSHDESATATLREVLLSRARGHREVARLFVRYEDSATLARVYRHCIVLATEAKPAGLRLTVEASAPKMQQLQRDLHRAYRGRDA